MYEIGGTINRSLQPLDHAHDVLDSFDTKRRNSVRLNKLSLISLGAAASCLLLPNLAMGQAAPAAGIMIDDAQGSLDEGPLVFTPTGGLNNPVFSSHVDPNSGNESGGFHGEYTSAVHLNPNPVLAQVWLLEPPGDSGQPAGSVSDYLAITFTNTVGTQNMSVDGSYLSDGAPTPFPPVDPRYTIVESPTGFVDVSAILQAQGAPADFTALVRSPSVPEPGSMALLVGMAVGSGLLARRRAKR